MTALAVAVARATSLWELAALAWLALIAVPLAFTDLAVHRLPDPLADTAFTGTLALLAAAALAGHQPGHLARAAIGAAALACFYPVLCLIRPGEMGLGDAKLAASTGLVLGWTGCRHSPRAGATAPGAGIPSSLGIRPGCGRPRPSLPGTSISGARCCRHRGAP